MNLYQKMAEVMKDVRYLQKDDEVEAGKDKRGNVKTYRAMTEEKVTSVVRESMIKNGIIMFPVAMSTNVTSETLKTEYGDKINRITHIDVTYRMQNVDEPEDGIMIASSGTGVDTQDKGIGKAMTYAYKYALLRAFAIPTGEDPDAISSDVYTEKLVGPKKPEAKQPESDIQRTREILYGLGRTLAKCDNTPESIEAADKRTRDFAEKAYDGYTFDQLTVDQLNNVKVALLKKK